MVSLCPLDGLVLGEVVDGTRDLLWVSNGGEHQCAPFVERPLENPILL